MRVRAAAGIVAIITLARVAGAHPAVDVRIAELSRRIAESPGDGALLLERATAHRDRGRWSEARADLDAARAADPDLPGLDVASSAVALAEKRPAAALADADRAVAASPRSPEALVARANALSAFGRLAEAADALGDAIAAIEPPRRPQPDLYLQRARLLATSQPERALAVLDEGRARLGPLVALELPAIELEIRLGRTAAALARLESLPIASAEKVSRRAAIEKAATR